MSILIINGDHFSFILWYFYDDHYILKHTLMFVAERQIFIVRVRTQNSITHFLKLNLYTTPIYIQISIRNGIFGQTQSIALCCGLL